MKKLLLLFPLFAAAFVHGQNLNNNMPVNNEDYNPPPQMVINASDQLADNQNKMVMQQAQAPAEVQQTSQRSGNWINVFGNDNSDGSGRPARHKYGQSINLATDGYSGSSGISSGKAHIKRKSAGIDFTKLLPPKKKFKPQRHYANKKRIKRCVGF